MTETTSILGANTPHPLRISRLVTGLWQLAGGHGEADVTASAAAMGPYVAAGLDTFDMADFYGPAEDVVGAYNAASVGKPVTPLTKWCPKPTVVGEEACRKAVDTALARLRVDSLPLLQYHVWRYDDPSYLENLHHLSQLQAAGKIQHIGVTNVDLAHLRLIVGSGYAIASNQVSMSVLDRRAEVGGMADYCAVNGIGLLAYGTLLGGFIGEKWLGAPEPVEQGNWSLMKYKRYIDAAGGWAVFQGLLAALKFVADKHGVPIATVAMGYVLALPAVAGIIVGSRLVGDASSHIASNKQALSLRLDDADLATIHAAQARLSPVPGDSGDENRYPPYLSPTGGARDFIDDAALAEVERVVAAGGRVERSSGSAWEPVANYCRAVRVGDRITVSGTTTRAAFSGAGVIGGKDAEAQSTYIFDIIAGAVRALGGSVADITRTRVLLADVADWAAVGRAQAREIGRWGVRPANTMVGGLTFVVGPDALVEIEAEAIVGSGKGPRLRLGPGGIVRE
ncbi:Protein tas [Vanrija pseudolonga]|uniref:Protein tas n=1 Tax=Vanrija pseudolonga TaxID=143232 RepID=A0AAF0XZR5_9TREE|nr:Protein tas [Vanrija pseudolonga]